MIVLGTVLPPFLNKKAFSFFKFINKQRRSNSLKMILDVDFKVCVERKAILAVVCINAVHVTVKEDSCNCVSIIPQGCIAVCRHKWKKNVRDVTKLYLCCWAHGVLSPLRLILQYQPVLRLPLNIKLI